LGNTPTIAQRHYLQTTEQHFQDALKPSEKALQNPVQQVQEIRCKPSQENKKPPVFAGVCESSRYYADVQADGKGSELPRKTSVNQGFPDKSGAESGALNATEAQKDARLIVLMEAWSMLPDAIKAGIMALVQATQDGN